MNTALQSIDALSPGANLQAYLATVNSVPVLSIDEERELTTMLHYEEDLEAARRLIMSHRRFVAHIAKSYTGYGLNQGDLIQECNVG